MGFFVPAIFGFFGGMMALGVIGLAIFSFVATMAGFFGGMLMFFIYGKGDYDVWRAWWLIITSVFIVWGLIRFISIF